MEYIIYMCRSFFVKNCTQLIVNFIPSLLAGILSGIIVLILTILFINPSKEKTPNDHQPTENIAPQSIAPIPKKEPIVSPPKLSNPQTAEQNIASKSGGQVISVPQEKEILINEQPQAEINKETVKSPLLISRGRGVTDGAVSSSMQLSKTNTSNNQKPIKKISPQKGTTVVVKKQQQMEIIGDKPFDRDNFVTVELTPRQRDNLFLFNRKGEP